MPKKSAKLIAIFKDTLTKSQAGSIPTSALLESLQKVEQPKATPTKAGKIVVSNQDCLVAAQPFSQTQNALVMNNANAHSAGGGVAYGSVAQEEDIMRRSNAYPSLLNVGDAASTTPGKGAHSAGRDFYKGPIETALLGSGAIVTKNLTAFKDADYQAITPFSFDLFTCAAPKLDETETQKDGLRLANGSVHYDLYRDRMEGKIRTYIYYAIANNYRVLIPGALGCGAFRSFEEGAQVAHGYTAEIVANIYKKLLIDEGLAGHFDEVRFAIMENKPDLQVGNLAVFQRVLGLTQNVKPNEGASAHYTDLKKSASAVPSYITPASRAEPAPVARVFSIPPVQTGIQTPAVAVVPPAVAPKTGFWNKIKSAWASVTDFFKRLWNGMFHKGTARIVPVSANPIVGVVGGAQAPFPFVSSGSEIASPISRSAPRTPLANQDISITNLKSQANDLGKGIKNAIDKKSPGRISIIQNLKTLGIIFETPPALAEAFRADVKKHLNIELPKAITTQMSATSQYNSYFIACTEDQLVKLYSLYAKEALSQKPAAFVTQNRK